MERIVAAFTLKTLQSALVLYRWLEKNNKTIDDLEIYVKEKKQKKHFLGKHCPECNSTMYLYPVNTGRRDRVGGKYKSMWACGNLIGCGHEEYNKETVMHIVKSLNSKGD